MRRGALILALLVALAGCDLGDDPDPPDEPPGDPSGERGEPHPGDEADPIDPATAGVSDEPCPDAIDEELGCLRLGVLADHSSDRAAQRSAAEVAGQQAFWTRVNEAGGIDGYEAHLETREVGPDPEEQTEVATALLDEVLALALLPGDATTDELAGLVADAAVPAATSGWWSGWHAEQLHPSLLPAADHSRCVAVTAGLDWYAQQVELPLAVLGVAHEGVGAADLDVAGERWSEASEVGWLGVVETGTPEEDGDQQDAAVQAVIEQEPDVVLLATSPLATGELVSKAAARGFEGTFLGTMGSWHPELLDEPEQAQPLQALYRHLGPWEVGDEGTAGHAALLAAHDDEVVAPATVTGWMAAYPMLAALRAAAGEDELTRPGVHALLDGLEVEAEETLPTRRLARDAPASSTLVAAPDAEAPGGLRWEDEIEVGPRLDELAHPDDCAR